MSFHLMAETVSGRVKECGEMSIFRPLTHTAGVSIYTQNGNLLGFSITFYGTEHGFSSLLHSPTSLRIFLPTPCPFCLLLKTSLPFRPPSGCPLPRHKACLPSLAAPLKPTRPTHGSPCLLSSQPKKKSRHGGFCSTQS